MVEIIIASVISCSEAAKLIQEVHTNPLLDPEHHAELVQTIKEATPKCYYEEFNYNGNV